MLGDMKYPFNDVTIYGIYGGRDSVRLIEAPISINRCAET